MKQKKWMTWLLGVLVIGIWGIIMQRVFAGIGDEEAVVVKQELQGKEKEKLPELRPDTFRLALNYPDPFTGETDVALMKEKTLSGAQKPMVQPLKVIAPAAVTPDPMEQVSYLGYVLNPETKKQVAIVNAGGKELMMKEGELSGQLQLLKISATEITIKYKNKFKQIKQHL